LLDDMRNITDRCANDRADFGTMYKGVFIIPALWQSLWNSLVQLGVIIGSVGNGVFQDRLGRRWAFRSGAVIAACGRS
jgi:MFS transporter, SP family, general alpha glucoside:H+ symporter